MAKFCPECGHEHSAEACPVCEPWLFDDSEDRCESDSLEDACPSCGCWYRGLVCPTCGLNFLGDYVERDAEEEDERSSLEDNQEEGAEEEVEEQEEGEVAPDDDSVDFEDVSEQDETECDGEQTRAAIVAEEEDEVAECEQPTRKRGHTLMADGGVRFRKRYKQPNPLQKEES